ncbi:5-formyltetrahydrofolate cyclo-ligase [Atopobium sp. BS2]|jgi:5-formyltetrahydrofolate cyclo-ligase|uniref:5-formyltetrahydrofolate cyclo-ligase n=1 Tax=Atopobium sp. BS2 TaxID=936550 RepID=UPI00044D957B|nr:5-formyltetrahydrofolate cyclo-ligase [Atopobium sp. BS2]EWC92829.1 5-formyltetrahydrofolate cyclo-ligase [Atopobium sp. BS2]
MDTAALEKQRLREEHLAAREALSEQERSVLDDRITQKLLAISEYVEATTVLTYVSVSSEVSTRMFIECALRDGKTVAVPRCLPGHCLEFVAITSLDQLIAAPFGLLEPPKELPALTEEQMNASICIVPALLVDIKGYRLGYGAGFYDRFLSTYPGKKICLAYQQNLSRTMLPHTTFDVAVDEVITESDVLTCA